MKKLFAVGTLALMSGVVGRGETYDPQVGEDPPPIGLEAILQAPPGA